MSPVSRARAYAKTQMMLDTLARDIESHPEKLRTVDEQLVDRMVAVSGYDHPLTDELFKPVQWFKTFGADKTIHSTKGTRTEVPWTNYDPKNRFILSNPPCTDR